MSAAAAGVILALALRLPAVLFGLAGLAAGGVIIGVELAVALREAPIAAARPAATPSAGRLKLLDTSAIIDGRIADLAGTGFLEGPLVVPRFVLRELQRLADGGDMLKRNRGKRGFEIVQRLQSVAGVGVEVVDDDVAETQEVDLKLLELARRRGAGVVTTDYNLNRLAEVSGIMVLNVNDLASALRPVVLPGEELRVQLQREGREAGQGVGFLEDGTMVVVDQGRRLVGQEVAVVVTSALQTSAGRMIFARLRPASDGSGPDA
ncbi:MAG TPA: TRAM domain-containing protein [Methylomirabilota bacterium]|jgi:uncharacterized protein YacL|nr:TRAM domain-containing protein [Methylomirabilota bacterium]